MPKAKARKNKKLSDKTVIKELRKEVEELRRACRELTTINDVKYGQIEQLEDGLRAARNDHAATLNRLYRPLVSTYEFDQNRGRQYTEADITAKLAELQSMKDCVANHNFQRKEETERLNHLLRVALHDPTLRQPSGPCNDNALSSNTLGRAF